MASSTRTVQFITVPLYDHTSEDEARELVDELEQVFQLSQSPALVRYTTDEREVVALVEREAGKGDQTHHPDEDLVSLTRGELRTLHALLVRSAKGGASS